MADENEWFLLQNVIESGIKNDRVRCSASTRNRSMCFPL